MSISKRLRFEILRRDEYRCHYCGTEAHDSPLTIDHVVPVALGGSDDPTNLVAACAGCNSGKTSSSPDAPVVAKVDESAVRWAAAMQEVARLREREHEDRSELWGWFNSVWCTYANQWNPDGYPAPPDWIDSVAQFLKSGLTKGEIAEAVAIAAKSKSVRPAGKWKYFCGICHKKIRANMELAAKLIADGEV